MGHGDIFLEHLASCSASNFPEQNEKFTSLIVLFNISYLSDSVKHGKEEVIDYLRTFRFVSPHLIVALVVLCGGSASASECEEEKEDSSFMAECIQRGALDILLSLNEENVKKLWLVSFIGFE